MEIGRGDGAVDEEKKVPESRRRTLLFVAVLVVVPSLLWLAAAAVPFLPLATATKLWLVPTLIVAAEAVFWVAALLLGREAVTRYRRFTDPRKWSRKDKR